MTKTYALRVAAAVALVATAAGHARAADFGGACCDDLEERVAELEATVARKGNRNLSLRISGQINQLIMFFDDGVESNAFIVDNTNTSTRQRFEGSAKIDETWSAGYDIELEYNQGTSFGADQTFSGGPSSINIREEYVWLQHERLGRLSFGWFSPATDNIILRSKDGANVGALSDIRLIGGGLGLRQSDGTLLLGTEWQELAPALDTSRLNVVRYDSPIWYGAKLVATWGADDVFDVAVWWDGKFGDFSATAAAGYINSVDSTFTSAASLASDFEEYKGSASVIHEPTGLFVTGAFVHRDLTAANAVSAGEVDDFDWFYVRGGLKRKWFAIGSTSIYGEYSEGYDGLNGRAEAGFAEVADSEVEVFGFGIVQNIDAAALELYAGYRHFEADISGIAAAGGPVTNGSFEDLDVAWTGARIRF